MLGTNRIVELIVQVGHLRKTFDRCREVIVLPTTTARVLIDHAELTKTVVRRGMKIGIDLRLRERDSQ